MEALERLMTDIGRWRLGYQPVSGADVHGLASLKPLRKASKALLLGVTIALSLIVLYSLSIVRYHILFSAAGITSNTEVAKSPKLRRP